MKKEAHRKQSENSAKSKPVQKRKPLDEVLEEQLHKKSQEEATKKQKHIDWEVDGHKIIRQIGQGGQGTVYHVETKKGPAALKVLNTVIDGIRPVLEEVQKLNHPNIVKIQGYSKENTPYVLMELGDETLKERLKKQTLSETKALEIAIRVAKGIQHAHNKKILHRDIKPSNILFVNEQPKVADFGIAKQLDDIISLTGTQTMIGSLKYMAPEIIEGKPHTDKSDVCSLACVIYEMIEGKTPYWTQQAENISQELLEILRKAAHRNPIHRYTIDQLLTELEKISQKKEKHENTSDHAQYLLLRKQKQLFEKTIEHRQFPLTWPEKVAVKKNIQKTYNRIKKSMLDRLKYTKRMQAITESIEQLERDYAVAIGKLLKINEIKKTNNKTLDALIGQYKSRAAMCEKNIDYYFETKKAVLNTAGKKNSNKQNIPQIRTFERIDFSYLVQINLIDKEEMKQIKQTYRDILEGIRAGKISRIRQFLNGTGINFKGLIITFNVKSLQEQLEEISRRIGPINHYIDRLDAKTTKTRIIQYIKTLEGLELYNVI